ncbi:hypothetical protein GCM10009096_24530 [Parasphingorhabdus litoris]|uniref:Uncharacterized protein n=1 Tax=Parasphingorhabdus litoris TaxID=394733 RepID=A0ABN1APX2_9SPHN
MQLTQPRQQGVVLPPRYAFGQGNPIMGIGTINKRKTKTRMSAKVYLKNCIDRVRLVKKRPKTRREYLGILPSDYCGD